MSALLSTPKAVSMLSISVIVPIYNEEHFIGRTLDGILSQDYPSNAFEVLVVDGQSTDGTREAVLQYSKKHPNVRLLDNPKRWSSAARNVAIKEADGTVVVVVDGHCQFFDNQYLHNIEAAFADQDVQCLGRPQPLDVPDGSLTQHAIAIARGSRLGHHPDSFIYADELQEVPAHSVGVAYRKSVFDEIGFFDESFDACEDVELNHRVDKAGMKCLLVPNIRLRYYPRANIQGLFRQMARYGRGRVRLLRKHADTFSLKSLLPAIFLAGLIVGIFAAAAFPILLVPYVTIVALYAGLVLAFSTSLAVSAKTPSLVFALPFVFMAIHFGAAWGSLKELVFGATSREAFDR